MGTNEDEAELIGRIYESTEVDSHGFGSLFQELGEALGAICGHHLVLEEGGGAPEAHSFGADPEGFSRYIAEYQDSDPRFHVAKERPNQIHSDVDVIDPHSFERSPIYVDLLRHFDIRYSLFFVTSVQPGIVMAQALIRPRHHSHFGQEEKRRLERLLPHLRRAMRLRWILQRLQQTPSDLQKAIDRLPSPTLIIDEVGRPLCMNLGVQQLLDQGDGLVLRGGRLDATSAAASREIAVALAKTLCLGDPVSLRNVDTAAPPAVVQVSRAYGRPLSLIFLPIGVTQETLLNGAPRARALVVVHDPYRVLRLNPELIAKVHGLTPTEAVLAAALAEGRTPASIARERGSSEQTVRTHIKRILEKTETSRQVDLVRQLLAGAAMHLGSDADR